MTHQGSASSSASPLRPSPPAPLRSGPCASSVTSEKVLIKLEPTANVDISIPLYNEGITPLWREHPDVGNSGSPVILTAGSTKWAENEHYLETLRHPLLLGIYSDERIGDDGRLGLHTA